MKKAEIRKGELLLSIRGFYLDYYHKLLQIKRNHFTTKYAIQISNWCNNFTLAWEHCFISRVWTCLVSSIKTGTIFIMIYYGVSQIIIVCFEIYSHRKNRRCGGDCVDGCVIAETACNG